VIDKKKGDRLSIKTCFYTKIELPVLIEIKKQNYLILFSDIHSISFINLKHPVDKFSSRR